MGSWLNQDVENKPGSFFLIFTGKWHVICVVQGTNKNKRKNKINGNISMHLLVTNKWQWFWKGSVWWRKELTKNNVTMYLLYPRQWRNISWCGRRNEGNRCSVTYCQCLLHWQNFFEMFYFSSTIVNKLSQFPSSPDGIVRKTCASVRLWHLLCTTNLIQTLTLHLTDTEALE